MKPRIAIGQRFTRLIVIAYAESDRWNKRRCLVRCDCGAEKTVCESDLRAGRIQSCKCLDMEKRIARNLKHGYARRKEKHPLYVMWKGMIRRCTDPKNNAWEYYGGRGIQVCERWHNFQNFLSDMGERPPGRYELDRVDVNGNYEPSNCRWVFQADNKRNQRLRRWKKRPKVKS